MAAIDLDVYRRWESAVSVCGEMWWDHARQLFTIEPPRFNTINPGHPCIPAGRYAVKLTLSPHLGYVCPELQNVPGRTAIRIHIANWAYQLLGCTGVGLARAQDAVIDSRKGFSALMSALRDQEPIWITYHDADPPQGEIGFHDGETGPGSAAA